MMHEKYAIEINKSKDKEHFIACENCSSETVHKVIVSLNLDGYWEKPDISYWEDYEIIQCQGCREVSFRKNHRNTEDTRHWTDETGQHQEGLVDNIKLYPSRLLGRRKIRSTYHLPTKISQIYDETYKAYCNNLHILTSIGIRGLLEAICNDKNTTGNNLLNKINNLVGLGVLTQASADILHKLRLLGNESAHEVISQDNSKLSIAIDIVENLLQSVYIMPKISKELDK